MSSDFWRPFLSRLLASAIASLAGWLAQHWSIEMGADMQNHATEVLLFIVLAVYGAVHRVLDKKFNPGDTASTHLAVDQKAEAALLKNPNPTIGPESTNYPG